MSKKRRQTYSGCSIEAHRGHLRLRFRVNQPEGTPKKIALSTGYSDTPEHRRTLMPVAKLVGAAVNVGKTLQQIQQVLAESLQEPPPTPSPSTSAVPRGPTVAQYFDTWIK